MGLTSGDWRSAARWHDRANASFTLLEVLIACAIFFIAAFAVLGVLTQGLGAAKSLQQREPDAGLVAAAFVSSNLTDEGSAFGDFEDIAPGLYPGYSWAIDWWERESNGLYQVDITVIRRTGQGHGPSERTLSILQRGQGAPGGGRFGREGR
jgi:hypothetical protein